MKIVEEKERIEVRDW